MRTGLETKTAHGPGAKARSGPRPAAKRASKRPYKQASQPRPAPVPTPAPRPAPVPAPRIATCSACNGIGGRVKDQIGKCPGCSGSSKRSTETPPGSARRGPNCGFCLGTGKFIRRVRSGTCDTCMGRGSVTY